MLWCRWHQKQISDSPPAGVADYIDSAVFVHYRTAVKNIAGKNSQLGRFSVVAEKIGKERIYPSRDTNITSSLIPSLGRSPPGLRSHISV